MKNIILFISILFIPININAISASSVVVMDLDNKRVLSGYNEHEPRLIASITNIMTT